MPRKPDPEAKALAALRRPKPSAGGPFTVQRMLPLAIEAGTLATVLASPGNLLTGDQRARAAVLLTEFEGFVRHVRASVKLGAARRATP